ncbi:hypothetical protein GCM10010271_68590 [Streptomyces kurssanovii]|nr:hypothetical protein GCM10010271_68590 [Streptomyces kurssanovii]
MVLKQEEVPVRNGYDIGIGVAMATGSPMALGAVGDVTPPFAPGGSGSFVFRRLETTQELEEELRVGADVSAGIGLFSGSASFDFSKRCRIQSSSLTVLLSAQKNFAFQQMDSPTLSKAASDLVELGKPLNEQFGEYFVRGVNTGGRFFGVVRIDTKSMQSKMDLNASLEASYGIMVTAEVKVDIANAMKKAEGRAEAFIFHDGGTITTLPRSSDPVELIAQMYQAMDEWSASVESDPKPYTVTLTPYVIALGPTPPNQADIEKQRRVLIRCAKLRSRAIDMLNLVEYILDFRHSDEFEIVEPPVGPDLPALQAALASDLDVIEEAASFAIENLKEARDPEIFMRDIRGAADFRFTDLPGNIPKQKSGQSELPNLTLTAGPMSAQDFPQLEFDVPDSFQATVKLTANFSGAVSAPADPGGMGEARHAGIALSSPTGDGYIGVSKFRDSNGKQVVGLSGNRTVGQFFRFVGEQPYGDDSIHFRMTVVGRRLKSVEFSSDGETFTSVHAKSFGGGTSPRKLILFAFSNDSVPFTASFTEPKIIPL